MTPLRTLVDAVRGTAGRVSAARFRHVALLGLAPWSLVRVAARPPFVRAFPGFVTGARLGLAVYAGGILGLAWWAPRLLVPLAAVAGLVGLALVWRARPGYGRRRGLPPGSLAILPLGSLCSPGFYREAAGRHGPVFKTSSLSRPMACVVGLQRGLALLREHERALEPNPFPFSRFIPRGFLRTMKPGVHETYRTIFRAAIAREVVDACEPALVGSVRQGLRGLAAASARAGGAGVAPVTHVEDLVFRAFVRFFMGVAPDSDAVPRLRVLYHVIDFRNPTGASDVAIVSALEEIEGVIRRQLAVWAAPPGGETPPRAVLAELQRTAPACLDDTTVVRNLIYMLRTGANDVSGLLNWVLKILSDHPAWAARLRRELTEAGPEAARQPGSLANRIVLECLRLEQSEHLYRSATGDIRFGGYLIPKGWLVRLCIRESHRDPAVFADPDRFDPDRFLGRSYTREEYSPFGLHRHTCIGDHLTRTVARIFATELAAYDSTVVSDGPPEFGKWQHWTPSSAFRITLTPRD